MDDPHVTIIPCRRVRHRGGLIYLSGVTSIIWSDGLPVVMPRTAVYIRLTGKRITGSYTFRVSAPDGASVFSQVRDVMPFDIANVSEDWFELAWLAFNESGTYNLELEFKGEVIGNSPIAVV